MDIFESLENLPVSEECFDEIMDMVEELLSEDIHSAIDTYANGDKKHKQYLHQKAEDIQTDADNQIYDDEMKKDKTGNSYLRDKSTLPKSLLKEIKKNPKTKLAFKKAGWKDYELSRQAAPLGKETKKQVAAGYHEERQRRARMK